MEERQQEVALYAGNDAATGWPLWSLCPGCAVYLRMVGFLGGPADWADPETQRYETRLIENEGAGACEWCDIADRVVLERELAEWLGCPVHEIRTRRPWADRGPPSELHDQDPEYSY